jgi:tetratricopeptide (TPR) repeat protein
MIRKLALITLFIAGCASQEQKTSIEKTNEGVKALRQKHYDVAIGKLEEATKAFKDNHTAWYNLGLAYDGQKKWARRLGRRACGRHRRIFERVPRFRGSQARGRSERLRRREQRGERSRGLRARFGRSP